MKASNFEKVLREYSLKRGDLVLILSLLELCQGLKIGIF